MASPPAEVLRGLLLLQPGRRTGAPPEDPHQRGGRQAVSGPHAQQHMRGPAAHADRLPGEQPSGGRHGQNPGGPAPLYGRQGAAGAKEVKKKDASVGAPSVRKVPQGLYYIFFSDCSAAIRCPLFLWVQTVRNLNSLCFFKY